MNIDYINLVYQSMPYKVKAVSTENADGGYTIFVNQNLTYEIQYQAIKHELWHIAQDDFSRDNIGDVDAIEQVAHAI